MRGPRSSPPRRRRLLEPEGPVIREQLVAALRAALDAAGFPVPVGGIDLEPPKQREHGDWSPTVALKVARPAGLSAREVAGRIVAELEAAPPLHVEAVEIAGPGFVNFHLAPTWLHEV